MKLRKTRRQGRINAKDFLTTEQLEQFEMDGDEVFIFQQATPEKFAELQEKYGDDSQKFGEQYFIDAIVGWENVDDECNDDNKYSFYQNDNILAGKLMAAINVAIGLSEEEERKN